MSLYIHDLDRSSWKMLREKLKTGREMRNFYIVMDTAREVKSAVIP